MLHASELTGVMMDSLICLTDADGLNTKLHAVTDAKGRPSRFLTTTRQVSDYRGAAAVLGSLSAAEWLIAERGYGVDWFRRALRTKGIRPFIPDRKSRGKTVRYDNGAIGAGTGSRSCSAG